MMTMMRKLPIRSFPRLPPAVSTRIFSSAAPAAEEEEEAKGCKPLYRQLSALGGAPKGSVFRTMNKWVRQGKPAKAVEIIKYVKDLRRYRRYHHALELMDWMVKARGMNMSHSNHAIKIDLISKVRGLQSAEDHFSKLPESAKNAQTYGALFNCYCINKNLDKAQTLYQKMKQLGLISNTLVHNNLMSLYVKLEQPEKVPIILQEMKENNISPDNFTYCIVMNSYASMNDIKSVEKIIQELEEGEVTVQWNAYSTLASIYNSVGEFIKAELALKKLEERIDSRDREPFHFLISLYATTGNLEEVKRVFSSLKSAFVKCTNMSYLTMLQALNKLNDIEGLKLCYEEWEKIYVSYDSRLTNVVFGGYLKNDMIEEAEELYERTKEREGDADNWTCNLFMEYYTKKQHESSLALKCSEIAKKNVDKDGE